MNRSTPGLPVHHQLLEFTQTHVHRVGDAIQPSHPLSSPSHSWLERLLTPYTTMLSLFAIPWTVARQAPLSMGFSRQGYWNGLPFPPPGNLPNPGIEPMSLTSPASAGGFLTNSTMRGRSGKYKAIKGTISLAGASQVAQLVKNLPAVQETWVRLSNFHF